mmetsp:Transcript_24268/g.43874  ORF Transcript_24268/g.43874 Transcript_24268/m.43874 type:complete len:123 (+) Transcript_24268:1142-1510(+)
MYDQNGVNIIYLKSAKLFLISFHLDLYAGIRSRISPMVNILFFSHHIDKVFTAKSETLGTSYKEMNALSCETIGPQDYCLNCSVVLPPLGKSLFVTFFKFSRKRQYSVTLKCDTIFLFKRVE